MAGHALLAGATGLIGNQLLRLLLEDSRYEKVTAVVRTPLALTHPKLTCLVTDFSQLDQHREQLKGDDVFCCLGTTIRKVKTKDAFRQVDYEYPLQLARLAREQGATQFLAVSALGANKSSSIFYNRVKGEMEDAVSYLGYTSLHLFRPSLLLGARSESRSGEDAAKVIYRFFGFLFPRKYKAIDSDKVARAMLACAKREDTGIFFHESDTLQNY